MKYACGLRLKKSPALCSSMAASVTSDHCSNQMLTELLQDSRRTSFGLKPMVRSGSASGDSSSIVTLGRFTGFSKYLPTEKPHGVVAFSQLSGNSALAIGGHDVQNRTIVSRNARCEASTGPASANQKSRALASPNSRMPMGGVCAVSPEQLVEEQETVAGWPGPAAGRRRSQRPTGCDRPDRSRRRSGPKQCARLGDESSSSGRL